MTAVSSSFSSMSFPVLPAEIHELIIEAIAAWEPAERWSTLFACAFVCASWHSFALRYTFRQIGLVDNERGQSRLEKLLLLMERNGDIARCVKSVRIVTTNRLTDPPRTAFTSGKFEQVCRLLSTSVVRLILIGTPSIPASKSIFHAGIFLLLKSPSLRHLTFNKAIFRTSFLEAMSHLETLTLSLDRARPVVLDHQDTSKLAKVDRLEILPQLQAVIDATRHSPDLYHLFAQTRHLVVCIYPWAAQTGTLGDLVGLHHHHWPRCTVLDLHFRALSCKWLITYMRPCVTKSVANGSLCSSARHGIFYLFPKYPLDISQWVEDVPNRTLVYRKTSTGPMETNCRPTPRLDHKLDYSSSSDSRVGLAFLSLWSVHGVEIPRKPFPKIPTARPIRHRERRTPRTWTTHPRLSANYVRG